jgi:hypothetical protein
MKHNIWNKAEDYRVFQQFTLYILRPCIITVSILITYHYSTIIYDIIWGNCDSVVAATYILYLSDTC